MQEILDKLAVWRVNRNMDNKAFVLDVEAGNIAEEYSEYLKATCDYDRVDACCDIVVFGINSLKYLNKYKYEYYGFIVDFKRIIPHDISMFYNEYATDECPSFLVKRIISSSIRELVNLGYDYEKCMLETIKEISSRIQDPNQMKDWAENGVSGKWLKDKNQPESTKYKADYDSCKLK